MTKRFKILELIKLINQMNLTNLYFEKLLRKKKFKTLKNKI